MPSVYCHKWSVAQNLISRLEDADLVSPQVSLNIHLYGGFCWLFHLACTTCPSFIISCSSPVVQPRCSKKHLSLHCCGHIKCSLERQSVLGLNKGRLGLRSLHHVPAAYIASIHLFPWVWYPDQ